MKINFMLIATGHAIKPRVNHAMFCADTETAKADAQVMAVQLEKAGYFVFELYDTRALFEHVRIGSIRVETVPSVASFKE